MLPSVKGKSNYTAAEAAVAFSSLIVIKLRFITLLIISRNQTASLVISIPIKVNVEHNNNIRNDKENSLFGFTLKDLLTSRKKLKRLIESVESTCMFSSKSDDFEKVYNSPKKDFIC